RSILLSVDGFFSLFFFSSRRRHTRFSRDWSSDVCSSDLLLGELAVRVHVVDADAEHLGAGRPHLVDRVAERADLLGAAGRVVLRSEERRVGKEWRARWGPCPYSKE